MRQAKELEVTQLRQRAERWEADFKALQDQEQELKVRAAKSREGVLLGQLALAEPSPHDRACR